MTVKDYFLDYTNRFPDMKSELQSISLTLRRKNITTMSQLCEMQKTQAEKITAIRNIGEKRQKIIEQVCSGYEMALSKSRDGPNLQKSGIAEFVLNFELTI